MLPIGAIAPDFTLTDNHGERVTLSAFAGKHPVVLVFYPADFSSGCTRQLCAIRDDYSRFQEAGAIVLGISAAPWLIHRAFAERYGYQFPLLADLFQNTARRYEAVNIPLLNRRIVYVVGKDGRIIFAEEGMPSDETILAAITAHAHEGHE